MTWFSRVPDWLAQSAKCKSVDVSLAALEALQRVFSCAWVVGGFLKLFTLIVVLLLVIVTRIGFLLISLKILISFNFLIILVIVIFIIIPIIAIPEPSLVKGVLLGKARILRCLSFLFPEKLDISNILTFCSSRRDIGKCHSAISSSVDVSSLTLKSPATSSGD